MKGRTLAAAALFAISAIAGCNCRSARRQMRCPEVAVAEPWQDRLGAHTISDRGQLLHCAHALSFSDNEVHQNPFFQPALGRSARGYDLFVIQYVSEGRPGVPRAMTALLYVPWGEATGLPLVALDHGGSGTGPGCGPTHLPILTDPLAIPLVGRGYAVIAPDYQGMGIDDGMSSFLVGAEEAAATLDGVRAAKAFFDERFGAARLGHELYLLGHSQGGHAALATQQRFDPSIGFRLGGVVAIAPGLGSARDWSRHFRDPERRVGPMETVAAMSLYSHMLHGGGPPPEAWLTPAGRERLPVVLHDFCEPFVNGAMAAAFPKLGDLYQPSFFQAAATCSFEGPCPGFEPWASALRAEEPGNFRSEAPVLILQGLADFVVQPATAACVVDRLRAHGTPVEACGYPGADHVEVITPAVAGAVRWIGARRTGETIAVCPAPLGARCAEPVGHDPGAGDRPR